MPLSEDSRALLQLLLGRGKSYSDISGLLGIDEAEVRNRATQALAEIDPSGPAPDAELTDYLLGQADPISKAEITNRISADPALKDRTDSLADQLRLLVPAATLPGAVKATSRPDSASTASCAACSTACAWTGSSSRKPRLWPPCVPTPRRHSVCAPCRHSAWSWKRWHAKPLDFSVFLLELLKPI